MPKEAIYGFQRGQFGFNVPLPAGAGAVEFITDFVAGFKYTIEKVSAFVQVAGTGAGATRTLRVLKGASTVVASGAVTLAGTDTVGKQTALTVTAADASFSDADTLTVDVPASGTAFTAGQVSIVIQYRARPQLAS